MSLLSKALTSYLEAMGEAPQVDKGAPLLLAKAGTVKPALVIVRPTAESRRRRDPARTNGPVSVQQVALVELPHQRLYEAEQVAELLPRIGRGQKLQDIVLPLHNIGNRETVTEGLEYEDWEPIFDIPRNWGDIYCAAVREAGRMRMAAIEAVARPGKQPLPPGSNRQYVGPRWLPQAAIPMRARGDLAWS